MPLSSVFNANQFKWFSEQQVLKLQKFQQQGYCFGPLMDPLKLKEMRALNT